MDDKAIFAANVLPTASFEEIRLSVCTVSVVPLGIVAAFRREADTQVQLEIAIRMNVFLVIFRFLELLVIWGVRKDEQVSSLATAAL